MLNDLTGDCECGGTFTYSLSDVTQQRTVTCTSGCLLQLGDADGVATEVEQELNEIHRELDRLNPTEIEQVRGPLRATLDNLRRNVVVKKRL